jgi:S-adenosylmethionine:tRNA ribosyltransferase-isomerase
LDALLPFDEPYRIPPSTALLIQSAQARRARIIAVGTSVVRALEHAAASNNGTVPAGEGLATQKIGVSTELRVVTALLSGTHEPGTSHYELLRAFTADRTLQRMDDELNARNYRTHEFGDSVFLENTRMEYQRYAAA